MANQAAFEDLTETTGIALTAEGASMMYTRYHFAASSAHGCQVLEIGAGASLGLPLFEAQNADYVSGDYCRPLLTAGRMHFKERLKAVQLSADALPFKDNSFDRVLFFEGLYYVKQPEDAVREMVRVSLPGGQVLVVNANPLRADFIPSPHSVRYFTPFELKNQFESLGCTVSLFGAFPVEAATRSGPVSHLISGARKLLVALGLVPTTLRGRTRLKRLVYRNLQTLPAELSDDFAPIGELVPLDSIEDASRFKVYYVVATRPDLYD